MMSRRSLSCLRDINSMDQYHYYIVIIHLCLCILIHASSALFLATEMLGDLTATERAARMYTWPQHRWWTGQLPPVSSTARALDSIATYHEQANSFQLMPTKSEKIRHRLNLLNLHGDE